MNAIIQHHREGTELPGFVEEAPDWQDDAVRVPHIVIHAFHDTPAFAGLWNRVVADRRLISATTDVRMGGFPTALETYAEERSPDLIVIETEADEATLEYQLDALADLCHADTKLIVVGKRNDIQLYRRLTAMGVSNYLVPPFGVGTMVSAITQLYREQGLEKIGQVTAVIGAKGGVGTSTVAESLALTMAERRSSDVLLVELDLAFGTSSLDLDLESNQGLSKLLRDPERIDVAMLDRVLVRRGRHLALLAASATLEHGYEIDEAAIERIIDIAQSHMRRIVLDIPHVWTTWVERALVASDRVLIVAAPELGSLRNAASLCTHLRKLRPNDPPPALVLNQVGMPRRQEIAASDIAQVLEIEPAVSIPFDARAFSEAAARGKMAIEMSPRRQLLQAFTKLAELADPDEQPVTRRRGWLPSLPWRGAA